MSQFSSNALLDDQFKHENAANQAKERNRSATVKGVMQKFDTMRPRNLRAEAGGAVGQAEAGLDNVATAHGFAPKVLRAYIQRGKVDPTGLTQEEKDQWNKLDAALANPDQNPSLAFFVKDAEQSVNKTSAVADKVIRSRTPANPTPAATMNADGTEALSPSSPPQSPSSPNAAAAGGAAKPGSAGADWESDIAQYDPALVAQARKSLGYFKDEETGQWVVDKPDGGKGTAAAELLQKRLNVRSPEMQSALRRAYADQANASAGTSEVAKTADKQIQTSRDALLAQKPMAQHVEDVANNAALAASRSADVQSQQAQADAASAQAKMAQGVADSYPQILQQQQSAAAEEARLNRTAKVAGILGNLKLKNDMGGESFDTNMAQQIGVPNISAGSSALAPGAPAQTGAAAVAPPPAAPGARYGADSPAAPTAPAATDHRSFAAKVTDGINGSVGFNKNASLLQNAGTAARVASNPLAMVAGAVQGYTSGPTGTRAPGAVSATGAPPAAGMPGSPAQGAAAAPAGPPQIVPALRAPRPNVRVTPEVIQQFLQLAGGNNQKAAALALAHGWAIK